MTASSTASSTPPEGRKLVPEISPPVHNTESEIQAVQEQHQLEKARNEHFRDETSRKIIAYGSWILLCSLFAVIIGSVLVLGWHLLVPKNWEFLEPEELREIKDLVLSGAVVSLGTNYFRKYLEKNP